MPVCAEGLIRLRFPLHPSALRAPRHRTPRGPRPDPRRPVPARIGQVLGILRTLITYGTNLAEALNQHASQPHLFPCFSFVATIFASRDIALILGRIKRGLLRAAALEERLHRRAAHGRGLQPRALRPPAARRPRTSRSAQDSHLPVLPTLEQIAAQDRRRPIGAVLVDICLDLGIIPGQMDPASWVNWVTLSPSTAAISPPSPARVWSGDGGAPAVPPSAPAPRPFTSPARPA